MTRSLLPKASPREHRLLLAPPAGTLLSAITGTSWPSLTRVSLTRNARTLFPTSPSAWVTQARIVPLFIVRSSHISHSFCHSFYPTAVVLGDTCDAIAAAHNVNTTLLHENNPQIVPDCSNIYVGEVLCVASSVIVPPPVGNPPPVPSGATPAVPPPTPAPSPSPSPPPANNGDDSDDGDDDDDDLPYCDEL